MPDKRVGSGEKGVGLDKKEGIVPQGILLGGF
jgi:hypothetical protein